MNKKIFYLLIGFIFTLSCFGCDYENYEQLNNKYIKNLDYKASIRLNSACIAKKPEARFYYNRANTYRRAKKFDSAIKDFEKAIDLKPDYAAAYVSLARLDNEIGNYEKAILGLNKALSIEPNNPTIYNTRGNLKMIKGDYDGALDDFKKAKDLGFYTKTLDYNIRAVMYYKKSPPEKQRVLPSYMESVRINE